MRASFLPEIYLSIYLSTPGRILTERMKQHANLRRRRSDMRVGALLLCASASAQFGNLEVKWQMDESTGSKDATPSMGPPEPKGKLDGQTRATNKRASTAAASRNWDLSPRFLSPRFLTQIDGGCKVHGIEIGTRGQV